MNLREELLMGKSILSFNLKINVTDQRGKPEQGEDDGVVHDIICGFFSKFVTSCTIRCMEVVPAIPHTMKKRHWKVVADLMLYGLRVGYFPIRICPVFLISAFFSKDEVTDDMLLESFKRYVAHGDETYITSMQTQYDPENEEDLIDVLDTYKHSESLALTTCVKF